MPQTTVKFRQTRWLAEGQRASSQPPRIDGAMEPAYNGEAGILPFGRVSELDPATKKVTTLAGAPTTGNLLIVPIFTEKHGLSLLDLSADSNPSVGYPQGDDVMVEYITEEDVVMWTEEAVNMGQQVHYRHTAGAAIAGRVRGSADGADTATLGNCYFTHSMSGPGLVSVTITGLVRA